jgi:fermentation-respiration switch protein FrsA (DUF1100 family)
MLCSGFQRNLVIIAAIFLVSSLAGCSYWTRYIFHTSNNEVGTLTQAGIVFEDVWFHSADGLQLHGWFIPGKTDRPLVLFFHGNAANITHRVPNLRYLHSLGVPVFIFDYRGYGASQGRPFGEEDLYQDARGALDWLRKRGWKADRMIFYGRSMGAAVALHMALENLPAGVVLEAPFTSLREIARETTPILYAIWGWWSIGKRFDNLEKVSRLQRPLLIVHGEQDPIVPYDMSLRLFAKANQPKNLILISGARHSDIYQTDKERYSAAWRSFIAQFYRSEFSRN